MLHLPLVREYREEYITALNKRNLDGKKLIEGLLEADEKKRSVQTELEAKLAVLNKLSKEIGGLYKSGKTEEANKAKEETRILKLTEKELEAALVEKNEKLRALLVQIPNIPHALVPEGKGEEDNLEVFRSEEQTIEPAHKLLPHWELAARHELIDFELGAKITGSGFPVYKGKGAKLQRALISYFLDQNTQAGYTEYQPPLLVNEASGFATGQLPDKEGQMYYVAQDDLYLIPTSEVPITNIFRDTLLKPDDFPVCCTAYTPCFRREAGSYGAHVRGLNRLHQFDKVEIVRLELPENSYAALDMMVNHVKVLLKELQLPYRILRLCGADLGFTAALTYDFEVFSPGQDRWLEISSVSNFESYQANRLKLRYKDANGKSQLAHTLNGSALALPRVLAGILENYQTADGIQVPEVLKPYTGFDFIG